MRGAGRAIGAALAAVGLGLALAACGGSSDGPGHTVIETGSGDSTLYFVSDNVDPKSVADNPDWQVVSGLPNGAVQFCSFKTSQGVEFAVWATGSSSDIARAECRRMGQ